MGFLANAAILIAHSVQTVTISTAAPYDSILGANQLSPYFFTTFPSVNSNKRSIKKFFEKEKIKTAVVMAVQNDWGTAHVNAYQEAAREAGVRITKVIRLAQTDNNDYRTQLTIVKNLNPDAILLSLNDADNVSFVRWYRDFALKPKVLANANLPDPLRTGRLDKRAAAGFYFFEFNEPDPSFVERFQAFHHQVPQISADTSYDALYVVKGAIEKGGASREGVFRGMKMIQNLKGASGVLDFTVNNYPSNKLSLLKRVIETGFETVN